jgi:hypothetical protein
MTLHRNAKLVPLYLVQLDVIGSAHNRCSGYISTLRRRDMLLPNCGGGNPLRSLEASLRRKVALRVLLRCRSVAASRFVSAIGVRLWKSAAGLRAGARTLFCWAFDTAEAAPFKPKAAPQTLGVYLVANMEVPARFRNQLPRRMAMLAHIGPSVDRPRSAYPMENKC